LHAGIEARFLALETRIRELEEDLEAAIAEGERAPARAVVAAPEPTSPLEEYNEAERARIVASLAKHKWNKVAVAADLKIPRRSLYRKLERYGLK
jgi:DNA-binding NtrC family response regulator